MKQIPLSIPTLGGNEWLYIKECLDTGWVSSVGAYVTMFETMCAQRCGTAHAVATSNGTAALHLALVTAGIGEHDAVLVPNITFAATANAVAYTGALPVLVDVCADTWQIDIALVADFLAQHTHIQGKKIAAIMPVHVLGGMCDMARLRQLCEQHQLTLIEDATESLGSTYLGLPAGSWGHMGCLSFNGNKIITTGGGGMLLTQDSDLAKRAKHLSTQAKIDEVEYLHDAIGYNYRLVNLLAAMGVAQLEQLDAFLDKKKNIAQAYREALAGVGDIQFQAHLPEVEANEWLFTIRTAQSRALMAFLQTRGIQSRPLWTPLKQQPMFAQCPYLSQGNISALVHREGLSLPCSAQLSEADQQYVIEAVRAFFQGKS